MEGWVVFVLCVALLFGLARLMLAMQRTPMTLVDALDLDTSGIGKQAARLRLVQPSAALIAATLLCVGAAGAWHATPTRAAPVIEREPLTLFPPRLGDWRATPPEVLTPDILAALGADDYRSAAYASPGMRAPVDLFIAWYEDQTKGGIHSPEVCLPGSGWEMAEIRRIDVAEPLGIEGPFPVNRAIIQRGFDQLLVYYWFEQYGGRSAWDFAAKGALLWSGLQHGRTDGALVRLVTPILAGEDPAAAELRIQSLLAPALEALPRFVPRA